MTAMDAGGRGADWGVGSAIGTAASAFFGHFVPFVGTALVAALPGLVFALVVPNAGYVQSIVDMIVSQIVTVTLVYGTVQVLRGREVSIGEALSQGLKRLGAAIGVGILAGIGIGLGMLLLIVPGLILYAMWAVAIPAATIEGTGVTGSLSRSVELTRGRRWRVFGALLVAVLLTVVGGGIIGGIAGVAGGSETSGGFTIVTWLFTAVAQAFTACVIATIYYFLRREKEGVDINQIASVFD
jgi:hypothetical protein